MLLGISKFAASRFHRGIMTRSLALAGSLFVLMLLTCGAKSSSTPQDSPTSTPQGQNASSSAPPLRAQDPAKPIAKKKKVWTNENLDDARGAISVVGEARSVPETLSEPMSDEPVDPKLIANLRQQLLRLQAQLAQVDKQLVNLKDFSKGESRSSSGLQRNTWQYNSSSVDEQLRNLQANKNKIQAAIDSVLDVARKRGIEPGQLR